MAANNKNQLTSRERASLMFFMGSLLFVGFSIVTSLILEASEPMMAITFASLLFTLLPIIAIRNIRKRPPYPKYFYLNPAEARKALNRYMNGVRSMGLIYGLLMLLFTVGGALTAYEIYEPDIPGGILIAFSGLLAIGAAAFYKLELNQNMTYSDLPPPPHVHEKEIIREKEILVKIRCQYCGNTFDEKLDQCPICGAKK
jgi:drug/metabolite transporter (DMT)-like permease